MSMDSENGQRKTEDADLLLYEKRVLSGDELQSLEKLMQQAAATNNEILTAEKVFLDAFIDKGEEFVKRLEEELELLKSQNAGTVSFSDAMITPEANRAGNCDGADALANEDMVGRLRKWYPVVEEYVKSQRDKLNKLVNESIDNLKAKFEIEDAAKGNPKEQPQTLPKPQQDTLINAAFWILTTVLIFINIWFLYEPEGPKNPEEESVDKFYESMFKSLSPFYYKYLEFHNIPFESEKVNGSSPLNRSV